MKRKLEEEFVCGQEWDNVAQLARAFKKEFKDHRSVGSIRNYLIREYDIKMSERIKGSSLNSRELRDIYGIAQANKDMGYTNIGRLCKERLELNISAQGVARNIKRFKMTELTEEEFEELLEKRRKPSYFETQIGSKARGNFPSGRVEIKNVNRINQGGWMLKKDYQPNVREGKWRVGGVVKVDVSTDKISRSWKEGKVIEEYPDFYLVQTENYKVCVDK